MRLIPSARSAAALLSLYAVLLATNATAEGKLLAVLPLDTTHAKGKLDKDAAASLEEMLRDVANDALGPVGWTVMTGENTLQVLLDNGVDPAKCEETNCHLSLARELKADKFLSGTVAWVDGGFVASIRLIDSKTGRILTSAQLEGATATALRKAFAAQSAAFFQKSGLLAAPAPVVAQADPTPAKQPPPPVVTDRDGDGLPDSEDKCPESPGVPSAGGCPRNYAGLVLEADRIRLVEEFEFEVGRSHLRSASAALLDALADLLKDNPRLRIAVECHSDSVGIHAFNMTLTQKRAEAIREALIVRGVDGSRLEAIGYGETRPIAANLTAAGRARNRRVELRIVGK